MAQIQCPGCKKIYDKHLSFKNHRRSCKSLPVVAKRLFKQREDNARRRDRAKLARIDGATEDSLSERRQELREGLNTSEHEHLEQNSVRLENKQAEESNLLIPSPLPQVSGRSLHEIRLPKHYKDVLPPAPPYIPTHHPMDKSQEADIESQPTESGSAAEEGTPGNTTSTPFRTEPDSYGVIREYSHGRPSLTPDQHHSLFDISDSPYLALDSSAPPQSFLGSCIQKLGDTTKSARNLSEHLV